MKKTFENLGYYLGQAGYVVFAVWAWSVFVGLVIRLTAYAWGV